MNPAAVVSDDGVDHDQGPSRGAHRVWYLEVVAVATPPLSRRLCCASDVNLLTPWMGDDLYDLYDIFPLQQYSS